MWRAFWYDDKENTIRGSFINISLTMLIVVLIIIGSFVQWVASNLREMETLIIGFFVSSFGLWTGKKSVEFIKKMGLEQVLGKHGLGMDDLEEAGETIRMKRTETTGVRASLMSDAELEQRNRERDAAK